MRTEITGAGAPLAAPATPRPGRDAELRLEESRVAVAQLSSKDQAAARAYGGCVLADMDKVSGLGPSSGPNWTVESVRQALRRGDRSLFEALGPKEQAKFVNVVKAMPQDGYGGIPEEMLKLLRGGKLLSKDTKGGTLLDSLSSLGTQKLADGIDRKTVMKELVDRILQPEKISQRNRGTCTVTTVEYLMASKNPAEFARLIAGLVSEDGEVEMADGSDLERDSSGLAPDNSGRANIDRIFQSTLMDYCNGGFTNYNNTDDKSYRFNYFDHGSGLPAEDIDDGIDSLTDKNYQVESYADSKAGRDKMIPRIEAALKSGQSVMCALFWSKTKEGKGYHQLAVTNVTADRVELWNPWGDGENAGGDPPRQLESAKGPGHISMTRDEFFRRMVTVHLPEGY